MTFDARVALVLLVTGSGLVGCGSSGPDCPESMAASVTLGTGVSAYEPLASGDVLDIYQGPQNGFMVFGSILTTGIYTTSDPESEDNPTLTFRVLNAAGAEIGLEERATNLDVAGDQATHVGESIILRTLFDESMALETTAGTFAVEVADVCGASASTQTDVTFNVLTLEEQEGSAPGRFRSRPGRTPEIFSSSPRS